MTADELAHALEALQLTQTGLARALGVIPRAVRFWLAGKRPVPPLAARVVRLMVAGKITAAALEGAA